MLNEIEINQFTFKIINKILDADDVTIYIVRDERTQVKYLMNEMKNTSDYVSFVMAYINASNIQNISEVSEQTERFFFSYNGGLFLCAKFKEGLSIKEYLAHNQIDTESALMLLERIVISISSLVKENRTLASIVLDSRNLYITKTEHIVLNPGLYPEVMIDLEINKDLSIIRLSEIIELFIPHINTKYAKILKVVNEKCKHNLYTDIADVAYEIKQVRFAEIISKKEKLLRFWKKHKRKIIFLRNIALISVLIVFVYYYLKFLFKPANEKLDIKLGEYKIQSSGLVYGEKAVPIKKNVEPTQTPELFIGKIIIEQESTIEPLKVEQTHTIAQGDTLYLICIKYYGSFEYIQQLAKYNNLENMDIIVLGQELLLPPIEVLAEMPIN